MMRKLVLCLVTFLGLGSAFLLLFLAGPLQPAVAYPDAGAMVYLPLVFKNYTFTLGEDGEGNFTGWTVDADIGNPIDGAVVMIDSLVVTTGVDGAFSFINLTEGRHSVVYVTADDLDKFPLTQDINILPAETVTRALALAYGLDPMQFQIVLTWKSPWGPPHGGVSAATGDLDAHIWISDTHWVSGYHIDASDYNTYGNCEESPWACYESIDVQHGYGPENSNIAQVQDTVTAFGVLNYYAGYEGIPSITESEALVQIYDATAGLIQTFAVPGNGSGELWYVFDFVLDAGVPTIVPVNCLTVYSSNSMPFCLPEGMLLPLSLRPLKK